jgi:chemotaxis family two-component system sensor kinase Cph1
MTDKTPKNDRITALLPADTEHYSTLRDGLNITNCDSEPVRTPGCVQAHGALLVLRLTDLCIVQASSNVNTILGHAVETLLQQRVGVVIGLDGERRLHALLAGEATDRNPLYLLTLPADPAGTGVTNVLDVTVHTIDGVVILEFESTDRLAPISHDAYGVVKKTVARLQTADSLLQLCAMATEEIRQLTGMDRVMVYKFHQDGHGEVFAESKRSDLSSWIGMHYPAEDIPKPARDLFSKTWLRPIPDMSDALAEMVPLANPDTNLPLDMTYCCLRGVSKMCTEYYRNMGVAATLTMSIRRGDHLWGLISCTYSAAPRFLSYQVRAACEFLAQVLSVQHKAAEDKEHALYRLELDRVHQQLLTIAAREGSVAALVNSTPSLLDGMDAGGAALYVNERWSLMGITPDEGQMKALGDWLHDAMPAVVSSPLYATDCLMRDYPPAVAFSTVASGLMALPLSRNGRDLAVWFRPETMQTVNWGGNPHEKPMVMGPNGPRLTPRASFELFVESVRNRALPWQQVELDAASKFRAQLMEIVIFNSEQRDRTDAELARSQGELNAFKYVARHDLKEPLRGIYQYAFQLKQDAVLLDENDRDKLDRMLRLTQRMEGLLDSLLQFSSIGSTGLTLEMVDLNEIVNEAAEIVAGPKNARLDLVIPRRLPVIAGHRGWCREIFLNLLSNALHYNDRSIQRVEIGAILADDVHARPGCPESQRANIIYYVADNGIGIENEYFDQIFKLFKRLHGREQYGAGTGTGLTVVRKLVELHRGRVWLESTPGVGTTFYFTLPNTQAG